MDHRIAALTEWQRKVYDLCWAVGATRDKNAAKELERMKAERPHEYEAAFNVWSDIALEVLN